jgi:MscS family membrane protein
MTSRLAMRAVFSALALLLVIFVTNAWAQKPSVPTSPNAGSSTTAKIEKDPFSRETPQGMVSGLMNALAAGDYKRAVNFFETNSVTGTSGEYTLSGAELARRFQEVLDRAGSVTTPAELSNDPSGNVNDGLPQDIERFGVVKLHNSEVPLLARRVKRDGKSLWLVSDSTLKEIPSLAQSVERRSIWQGWIDFLPRGPSIAGAPVSHWLALCVVACLSLAIAWLLTALRIPIGRLIQRGSAETKLWRFIETSAGPVRILVTVLLFGVAVQALSVSVVARYRAIFVAEIVGWLAVGWLLWRWADAASEVILVQMSRRGQLSAYSAVSFFNRALKVLLGIIFVAGLLRAFGVNVTAALAALGVGGLAIALGAQKLFENLIGSLTLIADRPIRIGDFCRFGTAMGTVEEIGIRSTRIRTLDRTLLTVPNGELSSLQIENFSQRDRFWFHPVLNLRYETSVDQMRYVLQSLRSMLSEHPKVEAGSVRVRLVGLAAYSLDVEIFAYVYAGDYAGFLEIQEGLLLNCMEIVEDSGSGFAFPSSTLYLGRDSGLNENRTQEIETIIRGRREDTE